MRSFRPALAFRVAAQALLLGLAVVVGATILLRVYLISSVDSSLLAIAEVEAQAGTTASSPDFHFRPRSFPSGDLDPTPSLTPSAQVLSIEGVPGSRSGNLAAPLPVPARALQTARLGHIGYETHYRDGNPIRSLVYPMTLVGPAHAGQLLQVSASLAPIRQTLAAFVRVISLLGLLGATLAWLLGWAIAGRALRPALAITAEAESIGVNELDRRVAEPRDLTEFNRMAVAFNALLGRLERAVTGTRRFTSDASHELRAPLTVLRGELELALLRRRSEAEYEEVLRRCLDEVLRLTRLADDLLTLTRVEGGVVGTKRSPVDLVDVVERSVAKKAVLAESRGVQVEVSGTTGAVLGDADLLIRAVDGLLEHAIMASPRGGQVRVRLADGERQSVEVTDSGSGIPPEEVSGVFQRFYRSNRPRVASAESGLGLPIARAVALSHGGAFEYVGNDPGASFRLSLPAVDAPA